MSVMITLASAQPTLRQISLPISGYLILTLKYILDYCNAFSGAPHALQLFEGGGQGVGFAWWCAPLSHPQNVAEDNFKVRYLANKSCLANHREKLRARGRALWSVARTPQYVGGEGSFRVSYLLSRQLREG